MGWLITNGIVQSQQMSNSAVISDQRWGFDSIGNRTSEHDLLSNVSIEYSHNTTNQLVNKKTYSSGQKPWVKGSLDEAGHVNLGSGPVAVKGDNSFEAQSPARTTNITAKDSAGNTTTETWQLNSGSGATPDATFTYTHDSEGNLMGDGTSSFEWDLRNRLTAIVTGTHRTEFTYDGSDRRVRVVEKESGSVTSDLRYIFHGLSLLEERAANNSTVLRRFYAGGHVDVANGGTRYAYTTDHLGSIREVMQLDGTSGNPTTATLAARYDYDLWGKRTVLDGGTTAETLVMHGYTGHIRHQWSGLWLAPYRAYNSGLGRWISRDPIAEDGGINLYGYVGNGVMVAIDPLGLLVVHYWKPTNTQYGHLSLTLDDGTYISNWPSSGGMGWSDTRTPDYKRDRDEEGFDPENLQINGLNEKEIKKWWDNRPKKGGYHGLSKNCAKTVGEALNKGGLKVPDEWIPDPQGTWDNINDALKPKPPGDKNRDERLGGKRRRSNPR